MKRPLRLGVNIDHVATIRQARGTEYPSPVEAARLCLAAGADGITVHLREDRRHIQESDLKALRRLLKSIPLNLEMANAPSILKIALEIGPDEVCLVPERREELTTEGGLDVVGQKKALAPTIRRLAGAGIQVSLFIEPDRRQLEVARDLGAPYVELHTGAFCNAQGARVRQEMRRLTEGANAAHELGLHVNAGHGINYENIGQILRVPYLDTLNIGHSIVARALFVGLAGAVKEMKRAMSKYRGGKA